MKSFLKWAMVVIVSLSVAGFLSITLHEEEGYGDDQIGYNLTASIIQNPELLKNDIIFSRPGRRTISTGFIDSFPFALVFLNELHAKGFLVSYKIIMFFCAFWYIIFFFILADSLLKAPAVSLLTAIASITPRYLFGTFWGMGGLHTVLPRIFTTVFTPLILFLFIKGFRDKKWFFGSFILAALCVLLHPSTVYLIGILFLTYLLYKKFIAGFITSFFVAGCIFMVFFNSLPEIANPYVTGDLIKETIDYAAITEAVRYGFGWAMFPISPASMAFVLYNAFFILLFASAGYMTKKRALCKDEINNLAAPFFISILAIAFTSPLIQYIIWPIIKMQPIINEEFRAVRFVYPILYIYVGYFFKGIIHSKVGLRRVSVLLLSFSLLVVPPLSIIKNSPDSLKTVMRKFVLGTGIFSAEERGQNDFAGELLMTEDESQEGCMRDRGYLEMCRWVSENTHVDAIFLTTRHDFKFYARRATRISWSDRIYWVQKNRGELIVSWYRQYRSISDAFGANDPKRLSFIAKKYGADYIVADAGFPALRLPAVYNNEWYTVYEVD